MFSFYKWAVLSFDFNKIDEVELETKLSSPVEGCLWPTYHRAVRSLKQDRFRGVHVSDDISLPRRGPLRNVADEKSGKIF